MFPRPTNSGRFPSHTVSAESYEGLSLFRGTLKWVLPQDGILTPKASLSGTQLGFRGKVVLCTLAGSRILAMLNLWSHIPPPIWGPPLGAWPTASRSISVLDSDLCSMGPACSKDPQLPSAHPADFVAPF